MKWYDYIEEAQYDYDWSDDTIDIAKQAYIAGLTNAHAIIVKNEKLDFALRQIENTIKESE
jgi:hypothetical protein